MTKFKVGDRVRLTGPGWGVGSSPRGGSIVTIERIAGDDTAIFTMPNGGTWSVVEDGRWAGELVESARRTVDDIYEDAFGSGELDVVDAEAEVRDAVNHPPHYTAYEGIEVIQLTEQMNFNRGNAVKYIARAGLKNPDTEVEDLEKAAWYINREIARARGGQ